MDGLGESPRGAIDGVRVGRWEVSWERVGQRRFVHVIVPTLSCWLLFTQAPLPLKRTAVTVSHQYINSGPEDGVAAAQTSHHCDSLIALPLSHFLILSIERLRAPSQSHQLRWSHHCIPSRVSATNNTTRGEGRASHYTLHRNHNATVTGE